MKNIIVVIGRARSGKTTFSKFVENKYKIKSGGTSDAVYKFMAIARNCTVSELKKIPKEKIRDNLIRFGNSLCSVYPIFLSEYLINNNIVLIEGIRRRDELELLREKYNVLVYYIHRNNGTISDNFDMCKDDSDVVIHNTGSLQNLENFVNNDKTLKETIFNHINK